MLGFRALRNAGLALAIFAALAFIGCNSVGNHLVSGNNSNNVPTQTGDPQSGPSAAPPTGAPSAPSVPPTGGLGGSTGSTAGIQTINHIIFMIQENRSFDTYFGMLNDFRAQMGLAADVDGIPLNATNPGVPAKPGDTPPAVKPFHLQTMCIENTSADWYASHQNFNLYAFARGDYSMSSPTMDGFAWSAGASGVKDTEGARAMGYYTGQDLPYHYFLASQFATSDRWFSPAPAQTEPSKMFYVAATSAGYVHKPQAVNVKTIFDLLEAANISWKIYYKDKPSDAIINYFQPFAANHASKIFPYTQYQSDLQNGTLPQVAMIEPAFGSDDEHPGLGNHIQIGAKATADAIDRLMQSQYWKDSAFIMTFDENGGLYDHVPPPTNVPSPDGIKPRDLWVNGQPEPNTTPPQTADFSDPPGDFTMTGYRVPLLVISPYVKPHYVSHTVTDGTSILKFIETRFNLPHLNNRDAAVSDMTDFFNFSNPAWLTPPNNIPTQPTNGPCYDGLP